MEKELIISIIEQLKEEEVQQAFITLTCGHELQIEFNPTEDGCTLKKQPRQDTPSNILVISGKDGTRFIDCNMVVMIRI